MSGAVEVLKLAAGDILKSRLYHALVQEIEISSPTKNKSETFVLLDDISKGTMELKCLPGTIPASL